MAKKAVKRAQGFDLACNEIAGQDKAGVTAVQLCPQRRRAA